MRSGSFSPGLALHARGDVDDGRAGEADGLGDVVGGEAAGEHERHLVLDAQQRAPVEGCAVAAGARAVGGRAGIEQDEIGAAGEAARRAGVVGRLDRDRLPASACQRWASAARWRAARRPPAWVTQVDRPPMTMPISSVPNR